MTVVLVDLLAYLSFWSAFAAALGGLPPRRRSSSNPAAVIFKTPDQFVVARHPTRSDRGPTRQSSKAIRTSPAASYININNYQVRPPSVTRTISSQRPLHQR